MRIVGFILVVGSALLTLPRTGSAREWNATLESRDAYLFTYFKGNGEDGLHLAYSVDGLTWQALNDGKALLRPVVGRNKLMRDPQIVAGPDGLFHLVWTSSWN